MRGFFSEHKKSKNRRRSLSCVSCGLYKNAKNHKMQPFGNFKKRILNIGEAPGIEEDYKGKQWQGKAGKYLQRTYRKLGIDLFEDCLNINAVNCRPKHNSKPTNFQINCCKSVMLEKIIDEYNPEIIVLFGSSALHSIIGELWPSDLGGITKWRGYCIPDKKYKAWICPTYHPSYILRSLGSRNKGAEETVFLNDIKGIINKIKIPIPRHKKPKIHFIEDLSVLNDFNDDLYAIDYETTGLKPQAEGHQIICASVSPNPNEAYVFMMPQKRRKQIPFLKLLRDSDRGKMAHNMKFEHIWSREILRTKIKGWQWDSMQAAHILDNRPGITGLKFQTYVNFGVPDYNVEVAPYLKSKEKGANSHNQINKLLKQPGGQEELMTYCGYDTVYQYRLAELQMKLMDYDFLPFR